MLEVFFFHSKQNINITLQWEKGEVPFHKYLPKYTRWRGCRKNKKDFFFFLREINRKLWGRKKNDILFRLHTMQEGILLKYLQFPGSGDRKGYDIAFKTMSNK